MQNNLTAERIYGHKKPLKGLVNEKWTKTFWLQIEKIIKYGTARVIHSN